MDRCVHIGRIMICNHLYKIPTVIDLLASVSERYVSLQSATILKYHRHLAVSRMTDIFISVLLLLILQAADKAPISM